MRESAHLENANLLHMPFSEKYHFYRLLENTTGDAAFRWVESGDVPLNPAIDFTKDSMDIRMVDVNNDRLIDIMRTHGTADGALHQFVGVSGL